MAYQVPKGNKEFIRNWAKDNSCFILSKNLAPLLLCAENISEAKSKTNRLIYLAETLSRQHIIRPIACLCSSFLFRSTLTQQKDTENIAFGKEKNMKFKVVDRVQRMYLHWFYNYYFFKK